MSVISRFKALLFGSVAVTPQAASRAAAPHAHEPTPPPGEGFRATLEPDAQGRYFVWKDATAMAVFYDRDAAVQAAAKWAADEPKAKPIDPWNGHNPDAPAMVTESPPCQAFAPRQTWAVSDGALGDGKWHVWKPAEGLETISPEGWATQEDAQAEVDRRNAMVARFDPDEYAEPAFSPPRDESGHSSGFGVDLGDGLTAAKLAQDPEVRPEPTNPEREAARASGARWWVEGPKADGLFYVYTWDAGGRADPRKGYTRRRNAQAVVNARLEDG